MITLTDKFIEEQRLKHKDVDDLERALYVLQYWQTEKSSSNVYKHLQSYMIRNDAVEWLKSNLLPKLLDVTELEEVKPEKRKDKYVRLEKMALDNVYSEFTTKQLTDASGLSAQSITKWAKISGYFQPIGRGKWEARNPKEDRKRI